LSDACGSTTDGVPNICQIPTVTVTNPACHQCNSASSFLAGKICSTNAECVFPGITGACAFFTSFCDANSTHPGRGCSSSTDCQDATYSLGACVPNFTCLTTLGVTTSIAPECLTPPYTSCGLICATGTLAQGNIGDPCTQDSDCTSGPTGYPGEKCVLSCPISAAGMGSAPNAAELCQITYTCQIPGVSD
jgi:hypothetical protein